MSLRLRLALAGAVAILVALALTAFGLSQLFGAHVERRAVAELGVQLDQVLAGLAREGDGLTPALNPTPAPAPAPALNPPPAPTLNPTPALTPALTLARPPADPRFATPYGGLYWQIEWAGGLERSRSLWDTALDLPDDTLGDGGVHVHALSGPQGAALLVLERSVTLPARLGGGAARAAVGMAAAELVQARRAFVVDLAPYLGLLALVLTAAGWVQLWVGLRPLRGLGDRVAALRAGQVARIGADWPLEVRPVAREIDALLAARQTEVDRAQTRAADLAHGLKTPLQALMGEADRLRKSGAAAQAAAIEDTALAMRRTVDRELARTRTAARAAARADGPRTEDADADPAKVADDLIAVLRRTPDGANLAWHLDMARGLSVALDPSDLAEALGALAENAARHARSCVTLSARPDGDHLWVSVADDGPGIPVAQRDALMSRHARADQSGSGLGLSIASEIALAAGGELVLSQANGGLLATLVLPRGRRF
jgi:signal transduction histidine kinase